jgi:hypothetical protein
MFLGEYSLTKSMVAWWGVTKLTKVFQSFVVIEKSQLLRTSIPIKKSICCISSGHQVTNNVFVIKLLGNFNFKE